MTHMSETQHVTRAQLEHHVLESANQGDGPAAEARRQRLLIETPQRLASCRFHVPAPPMVGFAPNAPAATQWLPVRIAGKIMKYALFGINSGPCADPDVAAAVAVVAEERGFESVWTGEHVVLPDPQAPPSPAAPLFPMLHPSTGLAYLAGVTNTIRLGTGIVLLAQRNPVVLAKEMASLDVVSQGRLEFGIGAGYLKAEFDALGVPFEERGARTDEHIDVMRELWTSDAPAFTGRFTSFSGIQARPQPVQNGGPPIVVGGASPAAVRRAVTKCQGWYGFALDVDQTREVTSALASAADRLERPDGLEPLQLSVTPRMRLTAEVVQAFEDLGIERLILLMLGQDQAALLDYVHEIADEFIA